MRTVQYKVCSFTKLTRGASEHINILLFIIWLKVFNPFFLLGSYIVKLRCCNINVEACNPCRLNWSSHGIHTDWLTLTAVPIILLFLTIHAASITHFSNISFLAIMEVHEDFFVYKSGIYRHIPVMAGEPELYSRHGTHSVKITGWVRD